MPDPNAIARAGASAGPHQLPVGVLHTAGQRHERDLVVMRLGDFVEWSGSARRGVADLPGAARRGGLTSGLDSPNLFA